MIRSLTLIPAAVALVVTSSAAASAAPAAGSRALAIELSAEKADLTTSQNVLVRFTVRNAGEHGRLIYLWDTPLSEVENDLFIVARDGKPVDYLGYVAKRGRPTMEDYVRLGPGQSLSAVVELSSLYDMSQPGSYTVQYRAGLARLAPTAAVTAREVVSSNAISLRISGEADALPSFDEVFGARPPQEEAPTVYRNCTTSQIADLQQALPAAQDYAGESYSSLNGSAGARYTTWFGAYTSSRYNTVRSHYQSISSALNNETITFDCKCKKKYYAYVYPNRPYEIFLCRVFWTAPMTGTDSKAGTIIHETSHFTAVAGTNDWAYGQTACRTLAISDPDRAIDNADSHEYYAENNPPQN